jgi:hypothetical protein
MRTHLLAVVCGVVLNGVAMAADPPRSVPTTFFPRPTPPMERVEAALNEPCNVSFVDTPLSEALQFIKDFHAIEVWIDRAALQDEGIDLEGPVRLELQDRPLSTVLSLVLEPAGLVAYSDDGLLKVSTRNRVHEQRQLRIYPVRDLAHSAVDLENLTEAVRELGVDSGSTSDSGQVVALPHLHAIAVKRSPLDQRQVVILLESLRGAAEVDE